MKPILATVMLLFSLLTPGSLYSADKFFDSDGVQIHYVEKGSGEPLILIHGFTG